MKLLVEASKTNIYEFKCDGVILALKDYSVGSKKYYSIDEIRDICSKYKGEIFVKLNKNLFNDDIDEVKNILMELDNLKINGVFFYDLAVLELKKELNLELDLVWNQTHMVNNYKTCDYYNSRGVKYALLGKEITLDEIGQIISSSKITSMVEVVSKPSVALSYRSLVSNYYKDLGISGDKEIKIHEKVSGIDFIVSEDANGSQFYEDIITNGTSVIKELYDLGCSYIIMREYGIPNFLELVNDTSLYISNSCCDTNYVDKYKKLGDSTNFFFKKTIYKVKKMDKRIELLSPAGDLERLKVTLLYGADAVYIGGEKYSLRANATNFSIDEIREGCNFAHKLGKRVHLTLNIVFHNEDMDGVKEYIKEVVDAGIDAFIVSDPFIISYIKENYPKVEVHLSTQNSTTNYKTVEYFGNEGVDRVVLARELSKKEIKDIIDKTNVDIEVFIHGAMCTCFSGRCALSNYVTNRDANRGGCAQVCRFAFKTDNDKDFTMATKDMNMSRYIGDLIDIGVTSMKVEGRMRSLYYLATVIGTYRAIIDNYYDGTLTEDLMSVFEERLNRVANRETTSHYFLGKADYTDQYYTGRVEISNQDYLGQVISYDSSSKLLKFYERNYFEVGDLIEVFTPYGKHIQFVLEKLYNEDMESLDVARHPDNIYYLYLDTEFEIFEYSMIKIVRRKSHE